MSVQPLLFLGERRRRALVERFAAAARRWRKAWTLSDEGFEVTCEPVTESGQAPVGAAATSAWQYEVADERVAVLLLPHGTFAWAVHEAGAQPLDGGASHPAESLAEDLEREVARSLLVEALGTDAREVANVSRLPADELPEWGKTARAWKLHARSSAGRTFTLLVSSARVDALAPARAVALTTALQSRRDAVGENTVGLRVVLGETAVPVGELAELSVDDVLVLDQSLTEPVSLVCGTSGAPVGAGNLGRAGAHRAIKITGAAAPRTHARGNS